MAREKYYITTPIYYPSGKWHIGHCYTTVCCDSLARFKRLEGYDVCYLTGTDEHGQKIEERAREAGKEPKDFVDTLVGDIKRLWERLDITYDKYIRTTDEHHKKTVQAIFERLYKQGDIYMSKYEGLYCTPCEAFWTQSQLIDGKCPDCGREVKQSSEESYFFKLSKYTDDIKKLLTESDFLRPESRVNEMVNNFLKEGLQDISVSRTSFSWGVPVSFNDKHIIYVWIDALSNYITALGYSEENDADFTKFWPADVHVMAKEIVRFHAIIWPALLTALGLPLPKKIFGHGWILLDGDKMSKSKGNVVDPFVLTDIFGKDAIRYYLLNILPYGQDGQYSAEILINKINTDLVNNLGNLVSRTAAMVCQYFDGELPVQGELNDIDKDLIAVSEGVFPKLKAALEDYRIPAATDEVMALVSRCNKYIDECTPWILAKDASQKERLGTVLYNLIECIRIAAVLFQPFLSETPAKIFDIIGVCESGLMTLESTLKFGRMVKGTKVKKTDALFPRIDKDKMIKRLEELT